MSSYNPSAKGGFTKTGKSLKAVRRYYAMLNQQKAKSPEEDKLSKRIALELKTQQEANEMRSRREVGQPLLADTITERSELPTNVIISPEKTGPVFIVPPPAPKSVNLDASKSVKSVNTVRLVGPEPTAGDGSSCCGNKLVYFLIGLIIGLILGSVSYMLTSKYLINAVTTKPAGKP